MIPRLAVFLFLIGGPFLCAASEWRVVWTDEFDGPAGAAPDPAKWTYDLGAGGWGNHELETYTNQPANVQQDGKGHLVITAICDASGNYTSARLKTQDHFTVQYGRIAARMKIARGQGLWPAFWMLGSDVQQNGWPGCGEIDVMENIGKEPSIVHGTIHGPGYSGGNGISAADELPSKAALADDYHVYAVEWSPERIVFFLDERPYATMTPRSLPENTKWVNNHPFFLLLNLAIGGGWPGNPDATSVFPQELSVDWVRVFRDDSAAGQ
jgi:beta-glucanase (GH16 family)